MKIVLQRKNKGSIVTMLLVATVIIGITLASYLNLVANQNLSVMRSQSWNGAVAVAEAGLEEAMAHLNYNTTNRWKDGWLLIGTNWVKERTVGDNKYKVMMDQGDPPIIVSEGYVKIPKSNTYIEPPRRIRIVTTNDALFAKGMVAKGGIELSGNRIKTDSFDSTDPLHSTNGQYDSGKAKDGGDVATNSALSDSLNVWNAEIWGKAATGPGGTVKIGPNGSIGSKAWHNSGKKGIEPGWGKDDMNVYFPDVKVPFTGGALSPMGGTVNGVSYKYILGAGNYQMEDFELSGTDKVLVTGSAVLYVTDLFKVAGNAYIQIEPNANLQLYAGGADNAMTGNGLVNKTGNAMGFAYWGLSTNKRISITGNAAFVGTIYAPHAQLKLAGGGSDDLDFVGSAVSDSVVMQGNIGFHYDENLGRFGPRRGYTVIHWSEGGGWTEI